MGNKPFDVLINKTKYSIEVILISLVKLYFELFSKFCRMGLKDLVKPFNVYTEDIILFIYKW